MPKVNDLIKNILSDMRVDLTEMFDRNFERKGFFNSKWEPRKNPNRKGSLLVVTNAMRKSIRSSIKGSGVHFSSAMPYTEIHNTGGKFTQSVKTHTRTNKNTGKSYTVKSHSRTMTMPQRQFIGDHPDVQAAIKDAAYKNVTDFFDTLAKEIKK